MVEDPKSIATKSSSFVHAPTVDTEAVSLPELMFSRIPELQRTRRPMPGMRHRDVRAQNKNIRNMVEDPKSIARQIFRFRPCAKHR